MKLKRFQSLAHQARQALLRGAWHTPGKKFQRHELVAGRIRHGLDHELRFGTIADDALSDHALAFIFKREHFNTNRLGRSWVFRHLYISSAGRQQGGQNQKEGGTFHSDVHPLM